MRDKTYAVKIAVDGKITVIPFVREDEMEFVDAIQREVGKFKGKGINRVATALYNSPHDFIVGDVILMPIEVDPESAYGERDSIPMTLMRAIIIQSLCAKVAEARLDKENGI